MIDESLKIENQDLKLTDIEIYTKIWTSPRLVFKYLNDNNLDKYGNLLLVLAGINSTFGRAISKHMGDDMSLIAIFAICIIMGGLLGWITYYIFASLIIWTGKWLDGKGNKDSILRMMAHAMIPSIATLVLLIPQIALFGKGIFQSEMDLYSSGLLSISIFYFTLFLEIILGIWTIVLFVIGISEVQKLSIGKSILNIILPVLIIFVPLAMIAFILGDFLG